ncbi:MAG: PAS domain S-box protein [Spirochaetales bacterium]|nr:PAS domain S-box protein [Spirochaetales bacterium]
MTALFFLLISATLSADKRSKVLLLNSYHKGYLWSDEITRGVEDALSHQDIELYVEYMDTKRVYDETYLDLLESLYKNKYSGFDFDVIITSDNNAINFFKERSPELFGEVPHVFCGYNFLKPKDMEELPFSTGINEEADLKGNIELIRSLHSETEQILILVDNTTTGKLVQAEVLRLKADSEPDYPDIRLVYDVNKEELINLVRGLPEKTVMLLTFFFIDREGNTYSAEELTSLISEYCSVPLYGTWNFSFGYGIIGGSLVSGYNQGLRAGNMARQITDTIPVRAIPVEYGTPYHLKYDYRQLQLHHIPLSQLPAGSEVFYRPSTFYTRNIRIIWASLIIFLIQALVIAVLIYLNRTRRVIQKKLISQGSFLKLIISHIPDGIYWKDRDLRFLGCNKTFSQSKGLEEAEIIGRKNSDISPKNLSPSEKEDREIMESGVPLIDREEVRWDEKGNKKYYLQSRIPIRDQDGVCIGILGVEEDVTKQKNYQRSIEKGEKKLRTIINAIPGHIFIKNREGRFLMANSYTTHFSGYKNDDLKGRLHSDLGRPFSQTTQVLKDDKYVLDTGKPLSNIQEHLFSAEGQEYWFQASKILCPSDLFDEPAVLGIAMDITALKKAEQELMDREADLQITMNSMADGVISTDAKGMVVHMNRVAEKLTQWKSVEALQKKVTTVLPLYKKESKKVSVDPVALILEEVRKSFLSTTLYMADKQGNLLPLNVSCSPIKNEKGRIRGVVLIFRDIREELVIRKRLIHSEKMDTLGQLAGGITHDFNNLLAGIQGSAHLLKPHLKEGTKGENYLNIITDTTQKAADLAKEILSFSRSETKESLSFDLTKEIDNTVKLLERTLNKNIRIESSLSPEYSPMTGDPSQVQGAIMNLGINASHAMPEGGPINIKTEKVYLDEESCEKSPFELKPGPFLKISLKDQGTGIPEDIRDKIFEPFFTTKAEGKGTGLGLAGVFRTMQEHSGSVELESQVGQGTTFYLYFPLQTGEQSLTTEGEEQEVIGTGHILVVDDDLAMRITAREILRDLGYRVDVAEDGKEGLEFYRKNNKDLDLIVLDMIMPNLNGKECFLAMKEINPSVKAVMTSGYVSDEDLNLLKKEGLAGFCRKPYTIAQLSRVVSEALKES